MRFVNISKRDGSLLPTCSLTKPFLLKFCILFEKLGHISPPNLCELQIRPFRPLLLTFMNRKLGGRPNICASVFFINSTDLTHYSFKIQNEIETRLIISPSIRKPSRSNQLLGKRLSRPLFDKKRLCCLLIFKILKSLKQVWTNLQSTHAQFTRGDFYNGSAWKWELSRPYMSAYLPNSVHLLTKLSPYLAQQIHRQREHRTLG